MSKPPAAKKRGMAQAAPKKRAPAKATVTAADAEELAARQQLFVLEYIKDFNGTRAATAAGYSAKSARSIASENLTKPDIQAAITKALEDRAIRTKVDADWMLYRLVNEVEADLADLYDEAGNLKPMSEWPAIWRKGLVAGIESEQLYEGTGKDKKPSGTITKIKLSDRAKRLEMIGRHVNVNAFKDNVEHDVTDPMKAFLTQLTGTSIKPRGV